MSNNMSITYNPDDKIVSEAIVNAVTTIHREKHGVSVEKAAVQYVGEGKTVLSDEAKQLIEKETGTESDVVSTAAKVVEQSKAIDDGVVLDAAGYPWDKRIHSEAKKTNNDGSWKLRRKPKEMDKSQWEQYVDEVRAELSQSEPEGETTVTPPPSATQGVTPPPPPSGPQSAPQNEGVTPPPPPSGPQSAPQNEGVTPPPPPSGPSAADSHVEGAKSVFDDNIQFGDISKLITTNKLEMLKVNEYLKSNFNIGAFPLVSQHKDKFGAIYDGLKEHFGV